MTRRTSDAAEAAAAAASEAARVLQARQQESMAAKRAEQPQVTETRQESADVPRGTQEEKQEPNERISKLPRGNIHREAMLAELRATRNDPSNTEVAPVETPPETPLAAAPTPPAAPQDQPAGQDAPPVSPEPTAKTVRVKVDGEEFDAPVAEVTASGGLHAYQIIKAQENRLKKMNEALAETRRTQAQFAEFIKAQVPQQPTVTDDQFIQSKIDTIRFGTPEESAVAMREVLQRTNKPVDSNAIIEQAVAKIRHDQAVAAFDQEFTDIIANPLLVRLVVALRGERIAAARQSNTPILDWNAFYRTIGNEVRSVVPRSSQLLPAAPQAQTGGPISPASAKEERKASIVNPPVAAARATQPAEEKPETREESLARMRRARGITVD